MSLTLEISSLIHNNFHCCTISISRFVHTSLKFCPAFFEWPKQDPILTKTMSSLKYRYAIQIKKTHTGSPNKDTPVASCSSRLLVRQFYFIPSNSSLHAKSVILFCQMLADLWADSRRKLCLAISHFLHLNVPVKYLHTIRTYSWNCYCWGL